MLVSVASTIPGMAFQPQQKRTEKTGDLVGGLIAVFWKRKPSYQNVIGLQSEMNLVQGNEAAHQQARANQQRERQGDLEDNHSITKPAVPEAAADSLAAIAQRIVQIPPRRLQCGYEAKDKRGRHRDSQSKQ